MNFDMADETAKGEKSAGHRTSVPRHDAGVFVPERDRFKPKQFGQYEGRRRKPRRCSPEADDLPKEIQLLWTELAGKIAPDARIERLGWHADQDQTAKPCIDGRRRCGRAALLF